MADVQDEQYRQDFQDQQEQREFEQTAPAALPAALTDTPDNALAPTGLPAAPAQAIPTGPAPAANPEVDRYSLPANLDMSKMVRMPPSRAGVKEQGGLADFGDQVWVETLKMGQGVLSFVSAATRAITDDPEAVAHVENAYADVEKHIQRTIEGMSPAGQKAMNATLFGGKDANGEDLPTPGEAGYFKYATSVVASFVPQALLMSLSVSQIGRIAVPLTFGMMGSGDAYRSLVKTVDAETLDQFGQSVLGKAALEAHDGDLGLAKKDVVAALAPQLMAWTFAINTAAGAGIGGLAVKGALGAAGRGAAARAGIGAGEAGLTMGLQAAGDTAAQQQAEIGAGARPDFDAHDIALESLKGGLGGAIIGGAAGLLHGRRVPRASERTPPPPDPGLPPVAPEIAAGLETALNPDGTIPPAAPDPTVGGGDAPPPASPITSPPPLVPKTKADLIQTLGSSGKTPKQLARMSRSALQAMHDEMMARTAEPPPAPEAEALPAEAPPAEAPPAEAPPAEAPPAEAPAPAPAVTETPPAAEAPRRPITTSEVQRRDGVGAVEAGRRAKAENAAAAETPPVAEAPVPAPVVEAPLTVADQLRAKAVADRAARKARMAPPGERMRGQGAFTDSGPVSLMDALAPAKDAGPPGTVDATTGVALPNRTVTEAAPRGRSPMAKGARAEILSQPSVYESEGMAGAADLEDKAATARDNLSSDELRAGHTDAETGAVPAAETAGSVSEDGEHSQGVTDYGAADKVRSGRDLDRHADDLVSKIINGDLTAKEASDLYGNHRSETRATLLQHARGRLEDIASPARNAAIEAELRKLAQGSVRELPDKLIREMTETAPERVAELRDIVRQIEDPVGYATDKASGPSTLHARVEPTSEFPTAGTRAEQRAWAKDRLAERTEPARGRSEAQTKAAAEAFYVKGNLSNAPGRFLEDALNMHEAQGVPYTSHSLLDEVIRSTTNPALRPFQSLARVLRKLAPDIEVMSTDRVLDEGILKSRDVPPGVRGAYFETQGGRKIIMLDSLQTHGDNMVVVALHETLHSITSPFITHMERYDRNNPLLKALDAIRNELHPLIGDQTSSTAAYRLRVATEGYRGDPGSMLHELHTMLMSDPVIQSIAAAHTPSEPFVQRMSALGFGLDGKTPSSVWRYFTNWVRKALGRTGPASTAEYTMLDHVLRVGADLTDAAADYNAHVSRAAREGEQHLPTDPQLRGMAEPVFHAYSTSVGDLAMRQLGRVDWGGIGDASRKAILQAAPLDHMVTWNRDLFGKIAGIANPLVAFRSASEAIARVATQYRERVGGRAADLVSRIKSADSPDLQKLMTDATTADAVLGSKTPAESLTANDHLKSLGQQGALHALEKRFDALTPKDQAVYRDTRQYYVDQDATLREAQLRGLVRKILPDATEPQIDALHTAISTRKGLDALLKDAHDPVIQAFGSKWANSRPFVQGLAKIFSAGHVQGDFFPLRRFGDYVVNYGDHEDTTYGSERFERRDAADRRRAELVRAGAQDVSQVLDSRTSKLNELAPSSTVVDTLVDRMRKDASLKGSADEVRDILKGILLESASRSESARTAMRRNNVLGASRDQARVLAQEYVAMANRLGTIEHGPDRTEALRQMQLVADKLGHPDAAPRDQITAQAVVNELQKRMPTDDGAQGTLHALARKATAFGYVQSLQSFSHMLTSTAEAHTNSVPWLGARHGFGRAVLALSKAMTDIAPTMVAQGARLTLKAVTKGMKAADWKMSDYVRDKLVAKGANAGHMRALFEGLNESNLIDHDLEREMQLAVNPSGIANTAVGNYWQKFMNFTAVGAHATDVMNKGVIAKAAFDLEMSKSNSVEQAVEYAKEIVRKSMPNYNVSNKPRIATAQGSLGGFGAPIMQFKNYGINMYAMMGATVKQAMSKMPSSERSEARKAFAGILATHAMTAGILTTIADPLRYIGGAYDAITWADKPHDYQNDVRRFMASTFGPTIGELMARGLPHAMGFDIHRRVGLGNLLEVPELKSFNAKGVAEMLGTFMVGASGADAAAIAEGAHKAINGDIMGGLIAGAPRMVRDVSKAVKLATVGVTDSTGKTILPTSRVSTADIAYQAAGFQPANVSEFREGRAAVQEERAEAQSLRTKLATRWLRAEPSGRSAVMDDIRQFNHEHPGEALTQSMLIKQLVAGQKQANQPASLFGLKIPPKARANAAEVGSFANVR